MSQVQKKPYLLFDAGGVLVFPDHALLADIGQEFGLAVTAESLWEAHCRMFYAADEYAREHNGVFPGFSPDYYHSLYQSVGANGAALKGAAGLAFEQDQHISGWTSTHLWTSEALVKLKGVGYGMSVISNSDGRVNTILSDVNLLDHFEAVFDSHVLSIEKPDPRIFQIALDSLGLKSSEAIYIGDVYYIDVLGANRVGLGAVQIGMPPGCQ